MKTTLKQRVTKMIREGIDHATTSTEQAHLKFARLPFRTLGKFFNGPAKRANEKMQLQIGSMYDAIRRMTDGGEHLLHASAHVKREASTKQPSEKFKFAHNGTGRERAKPHLKAV